MKNTTWSSHDLSNYDYDERQTCVMKMNDGDEVSMTTTYRFLESSVLTQLRPSTRDMAENPK